MKKTLLFICALLFTNIIFAQKAQIVQMPFEKEFVEKRTLNTSSTSPVLTSSNSAAAPAPVWSEDFANGIPSTWTNSIAPWVYRGPATTPNNTVGTQGAYGNGDPIVSPTASNGFIIFDSDFYDNNGTQGNFGFGPYPTPHNGDLKTDNIDLSGFSDLAIRMNSFFRTFMGEAIIKFYINGVFDSQVKVHTDLDVNESTLDNEELIVRMPSSVPGNSNVQIEFQFDGTTQSNVNGSGYYFWMLDDISIVETPLNLIELQDPVVGGFWIDYANYTGAGLNDIYGLDYTITPTSQLANHPYVIEGIIKNNGAADQTSMLKYEVFGAGTYSGSSSPTPVLAYSATNTVDSAIVAATPSLSPPIGQYGVAVWAESDSSGIVTVVSDTTYKLIEISNYIYAKDLGDANPGWVRTGGPVTQNHVTTRYEMYANEQLYSLRVYVSDRSTAGAEIKAIVYEADSTGTSGVSFYDESDSYTITTQDLGAWVDIPFLNPVSLLNGYAYECGIVGFQTPADSSFLGTSGKSMYNGEHSLFDELGLNSQSNGTPTWYYITSHPMIRLNFDPSSGNSQSFDCNNGVCSDPGTGLGQYFSLAACQAACISNAVNDIESKVSIYPNPSNGVFVIELDALGKYDVTIYNVLGQTVLSTFTNSMTTSIDLSSFDKGIYTVELKDKNAIYIDKVIVE
ncbi:MAG: hypothetical protein CMD14_03745 [Flavobacteriales bacterium]|nr:hypothetical protein [Flavobacteriales bacterium]|tara:strand:- start:1860 stop:3896 length:2037 start_codon:yes stop_codon:yes gene_type:complete